MQLIQILLFSLGLVIGYRPTSGRQDDPTAMVASMGDHQNSLADSNVNFPYSVSSNKDNSSWQISLDQRQAINLGWTLHQAGNRILFTLKINTTRTKFRKGSTIFGLGFSDYGQMESADFCLLWFDLAQSAQMRDAITNSVGQLTIQDKPDSYCRLLEPKPDDNHQDQLVFKFARPLDTCNKSHYTIDDGTTHLIWFKIDRALVVDMDRINLSEMQQHYKQSNSLSVLFESGLSRVQLAATKAISNRKSNNIKSDSHHSSSSSLDIRMANYQIPARETTYWCKLFKLPHRFEQRKFHITKYEAAIDEGNEHIVHHMELFNCVYESPKEAKDLRELYEDAGGWEGECGAKDRPKASDICRRVILAWAMGAKPLEYPEQVGQSIGGHHYSPYVVLEVHYNNVHSRKGLLDNSGLRFHFTHKLRQFDAGILEVGLQYTDKNSIPPGVIAPLAGYCVSECTRAAMSSIESSRQLQAEHDQSLDDSLVDGDSHEEENEEDWNYSEHQRNRDSFGSHLQTNINKSKRGPRTGRVAKKELGERSDTGIYIFAAQMHTHLAGVATWTEQIREGRLIRELQRDNHYSPHFQEIRLLPEPVQVAPGDALIHYCLYDTRKRTNITLGGFSTSDEMCVTYLHYYPRIDLEVCKSSVDSRALDEYFAYMATDEGQSFGDHLLGSAKESAKPMIQSLKDKSVSEKYQSIEWSSRRSRELLAFYASAPISVQCNRSNGDPFPGFWNGVTPTKVYWTKQDDDDDKASIAGANLAPEGGGSRFAAGYSAPQIMQYRGRLRRASQCPDRN